MPACFGQLTSKYPFYPLFSYDPTSTTVIKWTGEFPKPTGWCDTHQSAVVVQMYAHDEWNVEKIPYSSKQQYYFFSFSATPRVRTCFFSFYLFSHFLYSMAETICKYLHLRTQKEAVCVDEYQKFCRGSSSPSAPLSRKNSRGL